MDRSRDRAHHRRRGRTRQPAAEQAQEHVARRRDWQLEETPSPPPPSREGTLSLGDDDALPGAKGERATNGLALAPAVGRDPDDAVDTIHPGLGVRKVERDGG